MRAGNRACQDRLLLRELGGVVAGLEAVDADDRDEHAALHSGLHARLLLDALADPERSPSWT
jgi:hypothetical protein